MREIQRLPIDLGQLKEGESTVELRFVNTKGETEVWILKGDKANPAWIAHEINAIVWKAYIDDGVDHRLELQRMIIDRLQRHVLAHHDELGYAVAEDCKTVGEQA